MDELGFNKIAGAILATALGVMMIREVPHLLMHSSTPATPVYQVGPIVQEGGFPSHKPIGLRPWTPQKAPKFSKNAPLAIMLIRAAPREQGQTFGM